MAGAPQPFATWHPGGGFPALGYVRLDARGTAPSAGSGLVTPGPSRLFPRAEPHSPAMLGDSMEEERAPWPPRLRPSQPAATRSPQSRTRAPRGARNIAARRGAPAPSLVADPEPVAVTPRRSRPPRRPAEPPAVGAAKGAAAPPGLCGRLSGATTASTAKRLKRPASALEKGPGLAAPAAPTAPPLNEPQHRTGDAPAAGLTQARRARRATSVAEHTARTGRAQERSASAAQRQRICGAAAAAAPRGFDQLVPITEAEEETVSPDTEARYLAESAEFAAWAKNQPLFSGLSFKDHDALDQMLTAYLNGLFLQGEEPAVARLALYGVIFKFGLPKQKSTLPRARRALAGILKASPEVSKDPCPEEAAALVAAELLKMDGAAPGGDLSALLSVAAMAVQLDIGGRPSETLDLTRERVIPPQGRKWPRVGVQFHPSVLPGRSRSAPRRLKPNKSGQFDDTVMSSVDGSANCLYTPVLTNLRNAARAGERLFSPLNLALYEKYIREAAEQAGLRELHVTPHAFRHTMATLALARQHCTMATLMDRMRVKHLASVRHYAKGGRLQRALETMGRPRRLAGEALMNATGMRNPFVEAAARLRHLRKRRADAGW